MSALSPFFNPTGVVHIGATDRSGTVSHAVLENLVDGMANPTSGKENFKLFPISPRKAELLGVKTCPNVKATPAIDGRLAVITTPAATVPGLVKECGESGIRNVVVVSAGFKEVGPEGLALEQQIMEYAHQYGIRIIGPNCVGITRPVSGLNVTFAKGAPGLGSVAFLSQSGALLTAARDWSEAEHVGFSAFVSLGSMIDVDWGDLIEFFGNDPHTASIVLYMETVGDARSFLLAAREVGRRKPIIVIKPGRTAEASLAAASHTGSLTGADDVLEAAFRQAGVLRVETMADLYGLVDTLSKQPRPQGPRLAIVTNAGGPGVLATDALVSNGGQLAELSPGTIQKLGEFLSGPWSKRNPVDMLGAAGPTEYKQTVETVLQDPSVDGVLAVLSPQEMTNPTGIAEALVALSKSDAALRKPILVSFMGGVQVQKGRDVLEKGGVPTFDYSDQAAKIFCLLNRYDQNQDRLYETPSIVEDPEDAQVDTTRVRDLIANVRASGRTTLTETEAKSLMAMYGIPVVSTEVADSAEEAAALADRVGYPVVVKLNSETISHKTDVGGVKLNLTTPEGVADAYRDIQASVTQLRGSEHFQGVTVQPMIRLSDGYEVILGSSTDPQFGPTVLFGTGGQLVEVYKDTSLALPELNSTTALSLVNRTHISQALKGVRGREPANMVQLIQVICRFSQMILEIPEIKETDINPLWVSPKRVIALDARIELYGAAVDLENVPSPAVPPYPFRYIKQHVTLKNGAKVTFRPIRLEDEAAMVRFHSGLDEETVYQRFYHQIKLPQRIKHSRLVKQCDTDFDHEIALVAVHKDDTGQSEIVGVARMSRIDGSGSLDAEYSILLATEWQHIGLGRKLTLHLEDVARQEGVKFVSASMLRTNGDMQRLGDALGFELRYDSVEDMVVATAKL